MAQPPSDDPLEDALTQIGIEVEAREDSTPLRQMVASGLGGLGGQFLARLAGFGWLGIGLSALAGSALGHVAVTYRVKPSNQPDATPELR
jgi:hypothetical protein